MEGQIIYDVSATFASINEIEDLFNRFDVEEFKNLKTEINMHIDTNKNILRYQVLLFP
jgi:hypothetical protein